MWQELEKERSREQDMERKVLGLTKALSEARMEAAGLGGMAHADKREYFAKKVTSQLDTKRNELKEATARKLELTNKLTKVRVVVV